MKNFCTIYRKDTGQVVEYSDFTCPDDPEYIDKNYAIRLSMHGEEDHAILKQQTDPATRYVSTMDGAPVLIDRPNIPYQIDKTTIVADGEDFCTITGLHNPCEVVVDDPDPLVETTVTTVTGGSFEFAAEAAGTYTIQISRFPFIPMTLEIIAVDPQSLETAYSTEFSSEFS